MTKEEIDILAGEVFAVLEPRSSKEDMARVKHAYEFAAEAHKDQRRNSGEPYIMHPTSVALIAASELELDCNAVIAAFLHDVVEDTPCTLEDIRAEFGDDVAFLVDVVTKKKKKNYVQSKQVDNFQQILDSVHYDIRALLIKLSDRLHNMRTLDSMRPDKQMKIAGETDFFYAPLAGRLGLYHVKSELENLSFRYRCPREYATIDRQLAEDRAASAPGLKAFTDEIGSMLASRGIKARIEIRHRKPYSIWRNMIEEGVDFSHVDFKHYVRVIYEPSEGWTEKDTSLFIYSVLTDRFKERPGSVTNYIDNPKENGYQSFHVKLLGRPGCWEELHISSERMLRNSRLGCTAKSNEETMNQWLAKLQEVLRDMDADDFMEGVSTSFYNEDIFALTPKGRVLILPKGASAIDFAYELHTSIGDHAQYARINGKLSSIKTELFRGDCVEIGVSEDVQPQLDWLSHVKSYKAIKHLHNYLKHRPANEFERCPVCHPLPGDEVIGFRNADGSISVHSRHCTEAIKLASENGDSIVAVKYEPDPSLLYPVRINIVAIDRFHLLRDIIGCITDDLNLSMGRLKVTSSDSIVNFEIDFFVHSADELSLAIGNISAIRGVDEVQRQQVI